MQTPGEQILSRAAQHAGLLIGVCCGMRDEPCGAVLGTCPVARQDLTGLSHGLCQTHQEKTRAEWMASRAVRGER